MQKILYVEDNDDNVYVMKGRLPRLEFEVVVAADGEQGVAMAETEAPDLILMDLRLPGIDGWETTRRIKAASTELSSRYSNIRRGGGPIPAAIAAFGEDDICNPDRIVP